MPHLPSLANDIQGSHRERGLTTNEPPPTNCIVPQELNSNCLCVCGRVAARRRKEVDVVVYTVAMELIYLLHAQLSPLYNTLHTTLYNNINKKERSWNKIYFKPAYTYTHTYTSLPAQNMQERVSIMPLAGDALLSQTCTLLCMHCTLVDLDALFTQPTVTCTSSLGYCSWGGGNLTGTLASFIVIIIISPVV